MPVLSCNATDECRCVLTREELDVAQKARVAAWDANEEKADDEKEKLLPHTVKDTDYYDAHKVGDDWVCSGCDHKIDAHPVANQTNPSPTGGLPTSMQPRPSAFLETQSHQLNNRSGAANQIAPTSGEYCDGTEGSGCRCRRTQEKLDAAKEKRIKEWKENNPGVKEPAVVAEYAKNHVCNPSDIVHFVEELGWVCSENDCGHTINVHPVANQIAPTPAALTGDPPMQPTSGNDDGWDLTNNPWEGVGRLPSLSEDEEYTAWERCGFRCALRFNLPLQNVKVAHMIAKSNYRNREVLLRLGWEANDVIADKNLFLLCSDLEKTFDNLMWCFVPAEHPTDDVCTVCGHMLCRNKEKCPHVSSNGKQLKFQQWSVKEMGRGALNVDGVNYAGCTAFLPADISRRALYFQAVWAHSRNNLSPPDAKGYATRSTTGDPPPKALVDHLQSKLPPSAESATSKGKGRGGKKRKWYR